MPAEPRVLVVTPTLGESRLLDETVRSVARQGLAIRHVLSAPAARQAALRSRYLQTHVVTDLGRTGGIYGALNAALNASRDADWDWFTYINDDDALLPGFGTALRHHTRWEEPEPVIYGDVAAVDGDSRPISLVTVESDPAWIPALLQQGISPLMQQGLVMHRSVVQRLAAFDLRYRLCADLDFWLRAYAGGAAFRYYPMRLAQFRIHVGQLSGATAVTQREQAEIVRRHLPETVPAGRRRFACWRYRARNLPRYLARVRRRGWTTSYQLLQGTGNRG